ncbi:MAG: hypothetical protein GY759_22440 [Chloroflexi bacterium]|nr:hypothetical protein [Chloroflexota bacterium]
MDTVTLQGPVVVLPAGEYQTLLDRLSNLEKLVDHLTTLMEDNQDLATMREVEVEYRTGGGVPFADLLAEVESDSE